MIIVLKRLAEWLKGSRLSKNRVGRFIYEVLVEMVGVTWPSKDEVVSSTVVVLVTLVITAAFLYLASYSSSKFLDFLGWGLAYVNQLFA